MVEASLDRQVKEGLRLRTRVILGLTGSLLVALSIPSGAEGDGTGGFGGGSGSVQTEGSVTSTGAQGSVSSQGGIARSGRTAHRGGGARTISCTYRRSVSNTTHGQAGDDVANPHALEPGIILWRTCVNVATGASLGTNIYTTTAPTPGAPAAIDVTGQLIDAAMANIDIDLPEPHFSPPGTTLPNIDTWLWINDQAQQTASASAAGVTITVTAKVVNTTHEVMPSPNAGITSRDDHHRIVCTSVGVAYSPERDESTNGCRYRFSAPTRDLTVETTATWHASWAATNGTSGDLGTIERTTTTPYRVQEKHTVIRHSATSGE